MLRRRSMSVVTDTDLSGLSALAVDDDTMTTEPISMPLRDCGVARIDTAENGEAALERLALREVHLLVCDLNSATSTCPAWTACSS